MLPPDARVGDFRVKAKIGEGAMGQVYLAQDLVLGRRVALKVLRREIVERGGVERFLEEARATATFSHPHIVTLHAVGEYDGRPYLALEYLDGESLRSRCAAGPLPERDALRVMRSIAEAVAEAHGRGLIHADLKPENVMVPRDGRIRVVDFGLSRLTGSPGTGASGTPSYMAPERWTGATPSPAIDVWALGVMLHEQMTGSRPLSDGELARLAFSQEDPVLPPSGAGWATLVSACLARAPERRPNADEVVRRLSALLEPREAATGAEPACPFPGLIAFGRDDSAHYFGRGSDLDAILETLRTRPFVPLVGPSGVGKSSFVSAAVIPRLEETGAWSIVTCRPGPTPFAALATALGRPELGPAWRDEPARLALGLGEHAAQAGRRVLLFIDQFEEAFTLAPEVASVFCTALAQAAIDNEPWRIVLTLRDDFLARLAEPVAMRAHLGAVQVLGPMTQHDLREAVRGPLRKLAYTTDTEALPGRIASDVAGQPASLALLQFACRALWERRDNEGRRLLTAEYEAMGGASGALAIHGERVLAELTPEQVRRVRGVFLSLVGSDGTRRPRARRSLEDGHLGATGALIELLLARRLLVVARQLDDDEPVVELAHEALASAWPRLARWLDETHEQRLLVAEVEQAASLWDKRGRHDEETWTGDALAEAVRKVAVWSVELPTESRRFLDAGVARTRKLRLRRRWWLGAIASVLLAATAAAGIAAFAFARSEREAQMQKRRVLAQQEEIKLAAADMGRFELRLKPFDWNPKTQVASTPSSPPHLEWALLAPSVDDPQEPGREFVEGVDVRKGKPAWKDGAWLETIEARSGRVFLRVRRGDCEPSYVVLQRLPGYRERSTAEPLTINVPTCQATLATTVDIPKDSFFLNVDDPGGRSTHDVSTSSDAFKIDKTEVTRGAFHMYTSMESVTGDETAPESYLDASVRAQLSLPAVGFNYRTARNYCRYVGKQLPTGEQWQRAFRGGFDKYPADDPRSKRTTVWVVPATAYPTNLAYEYPTPAKIAPVGEFEDDTSPYGIVDLAGNVSEWTTDPAPNQLRIVRGANWGSPPSLGQEEITWSNMRPDQTVEYGIGVRCVVPDATDIAPSTPP